MSLKSLAFYYQFAMTPELTDPLCCQSSDVAVLVETLTVIVVEETSCVFLETSGVFVETLSVLVENSSVSEETWIFEETSIASVKTPTALALTLSRFVETWNVSFEKIHLVYEETLIACAETWNALEKNGEAEINGVRRFAAHLEMKMAVVYDNAKRWPKK